MKILILNKIDFNKFMQYNAITDDNVETKDVLIVSINSPYDPDKLKKYNDSVYSYFKRNHSNVMIMHFGDYGEYAVEFLQNHESYTIFNNYKAKKLYEFIKRNKDKSLAVLHCGAGISRSGAVGTFIYDVYGSMTWDEFHRKNPKVVPNMQVLRLLREQLNNDKDKYNKNES